MALFETESLYVFHEYQYYEKLHDHTFISFLYFVHSLEISL